MIFQTHKFIALISCYFFTRTHGFEDSSSSRFRHALNHTVSERLNSHHPAHASLSIPPLPLFHLLSFQLLVSLLNRVSR